MYGVPEKILLWQGLPFPKVFALLVYLALGFAGIYAILFKFRKSHLDWFVLGYLIFNIFLIFHPQQNILAGMIGFKDNGLPILWYFIARSFLSESNIHKFYRINVWTLLLLAGYGLYMVMIGLPIWDQYWLNHFGKEYASNLYHGSALRIWGPMNNFTEYGVSLAVLLGFSAVFCKDFTLGKKRIYEITILLSLVFYGLINLYTPERTPLGILLIIMVVMFVRWMYIGRRKMFNTILKIYGLLSMGLITGLSFLYLLNRARTSAFKELGELVIPWKADSVVSRYTFWKSTWSLFLKNPQGIGIGNLSASIRYWLGASSYIAPHQNFISIGLGYGLIGLALFCFLLVAFFWSNLKSAAYAKKLLQNKVAYFKMSILLAWIVVSFFQLPFTGHLAKLFWVIMGLTVFTKKF